MRWSGKSRNRLRWPKQMSGKLKRRWTSNAGNGSKSFITRRWVARRPSARPFWPMPARTTPNLNSNFFVPHFSVKAVSQNFVSAYSVSPGIEAANSTSINFIRRTYDAEEI